jgi:hypothetical protein
MNEIRIRRRPSLMSTRAFRLARESHQEDLIESIRERRAEGGLSIRDAVAEIVRDVRFVRRLIRDARACHPPRAEV